MSVHVGYTVTDNTVPNSHSGAPPLRLAQSYTPRKSLQITIAGEFAMVEEYVRVEDRARQLAQEHAKAARQKLMRMGIRAEVSGWVQKWTVEKVQCYSSHEAVAP